MAADPGGDVIDPGAVGKLVTARRGEAGVEGDGGGRGAAEQVELAEHAEI